jgi:hypothetical protein
MRVLISDRDRSISIVQLYRSTKLQFRALLGGLKWRIFLALALAGVLARLLLGDL